jgi:pimeloyl-ACP methyl ester carboxylesterase/DNA-binding winged helix-turn-helix (wHTH) protein
MKAVAGHPQMRFLFGDYAIDADRRELNRAGNAIHVEPQVFDLILHLIRNRDRVVSKDDLLANVWDGRIVSESTLSNRVNAARRAIGDSGEQQQFIKTITRRGLRFVGEVYEEVPEQARPASVAAQPESMAAAPAPASSPQEITFCRTPDGVNLAVATSGDGLPLVKTANWLNHLEFDWQSPIWSPMLNLLSERCRLVRYDERGTGLSDWNVNEISFDAFVRDLETVVDTLGLERFALLGISQGAAVSIAYATRHPDRVSRLILYGGFSVGWRKSGSAKLISQLEALLTLVRHGWGQDNPAFRQIFTSLFVPGATDEEAKWWNDLERASTSPENAIRLIDTFGVIDVRDLLPQVKAPTLVIHSRGDLPVPFKLGLALARGIPGARLLALESDNHLILSHEPAWDRFAQEVSDFLGEGGKGG